MKRALKDFIRTLGLSLGLSLCLSGLIIAAASSPAAAQKKYDTGVTDTEIKIGNIMPYSGPASAYGIIGKTMSAYFRMINDNGGVNGRKISFISYDDAYSPPKTVEQARKLVESDEVFLIFAPLGTAQQRGDPEIHEHHEGAAAVRRHRRVALGRSRALPLDHRLAAELPGRGAHLRDLHPAAASQRQDRRAVPERRFRQGLCARA